MQWDPDRGLHLRMAFAVALLGVMPFAFVYTMSWAVTNVIEPLADAHIDIYDVVTSATSVSVFVPWDDREQALELVQGVF